MKRYLGKKDGKTNEANAYGGGYRTSGYFNPSGNTRPHGYYGDADDDGFVTDENNYHDEGFYPRDEEEQNEQYLHRLHRHGYQSYSKDTWKQIPGYSWDIQGSKPDKSDKKDESSEESTDDTSTKEEKKEEKIEEKEEA